MKGCASNKNGVEDERLRRKNLLQCSWTSAKQKRLSPAKSRWARHKPYSCTGKSPRWTKKKNKAQKGRAHRAQKMQGGARQVGMQIDQSETGPVPNRKLETRTVKLQVASEKCDGQILRKTILENCNKFSMNCSTTYCTWMMKALRYLLSYCDNEE